ncbi:hypothetical protein AXFE_24570 [Acidithrix ferrooxidans]|uniref:Uncharacterized protein n=2 Tax=Acidithrix ferrooxidans TaxID=1280514 RepID=A0A0D8HFV6_9ACTN|nr:hypothetical protein AXFE_24570 [Acidithrix ferrooxidans]
MFKTPISKNTTSVKKTDATLERSHLFGTLFNQCALLNPRALGLSQNMEWSHLDALPPHYCKWYKIESKITSTKSQDYVLDVKFIPQVDYDYSKATVTRSAHPTCETTDRANWAGQNFRVVQFANILCLWLSDPHPHQWHDQGHPTKELDLITIDLAADLSPGLERRLEIIPRSTNRPMSNYPAVQSRKFPKKSKPHGTVEGVIYFAPTHLGVPIRTSLTI